MPQPPQFPIQSRELNRIIPFAAQRTFRNAALGAGATMIAAFDVGLVVTDFNQFIGGTINAANNPSADPTQFAIGPLLDALAFSAGAGSILVEYAVDYTCSYRAIATTIVPATVATNISGLRVTGRFVRVTYTNTSGGAALVEFGVYLRSN
jgi:hypothetical protein